jgi:tripartite-type tricarboxylate transporter receptor subunit TctC
MMPYYDMICGGFVSWTKKATPALVAIFVIQLIAASSQAIAADYPDHTIKVVTPFAPGAASDVQLRFLAEKMGKALHVGVVVENRPGSGGVAAGKAVSNAAPDGYTIGWVGNSNAIGVSLFQEPFDPRVEMRPIVGVSEFANLFVTNDRSQFHTLQDVIQFAHENPNKLNIGTSGAGTSNNLVAHLFALQTDAKVTIVPYRGPSELQIAIERGDIDLLVNAYAGLQGVLEAHKVRALAITSAKRDPELPDVPTMAEAGVADFVATSWNAFYGPKKMPSEAVKVLEAAVTTILHEPDTVAKFKSLGFDAIEMPADQLGKRMEDEVDRWRKVIEAAGIEKQ